MNNKTASFRKSRSTGAETTVKAKAKAASTNIAPEPKTRKLSPLLHHVLVGKGGCGAAPAPPTKEYTDMGFFRAWAYPLLLIVVCTALASVFPFMVHSRGASVMRTVTEFTTLEETMAALPRPSWVGAAIFFGWLLFQGLLLEFIPGAKVYGPPTPAGEEPEYIDNGIKCWVITHAAYMILGAPGLGLIPFGALYTYWGEFLSTSSVLAMVLCLFLYWKGKNYPSSGDAVWTDKSVFDFFQGTELHPRLFGINVKQLLNCRFSMMGWSVVQLCFAEAQYDATGAVSTEMFVCAFLTVAYLLKFFWWEAGYFRSIDIIHDRCGYYIVWGVVCWVPACYCFPAFVAVGHPQNWPMWLAISVSVFGLAALYVNYDADHQRMHFRAMKGDVMVWGSPAKFIAAQYTTTDGESRTSLLLHSGYWGVSRHFHYIPELTLAFCWCLPAISSGLLLGWFYFIFLLILLTDRSMRDDEKCSQKYGDYWRAYCKKVPYKIVPGLF